MIASLSSVSSVAVSGFNAAARRLGVSAHNIANLETDGFRPLRFNQVELASGGSGGSVERAETPEPVDLAREFVEQIRARVQAQASLRVFGVAAELSGQLVDLTA